MRTKLLLALASVLWALIGPHGGARAQIERVKPSAATRACGSGVVWRADLDQALEEARREHRPVLWYVPTVRGSRMDRRGEIDLYMMAGPFSAPAVEVLLNRRFIPVKAIARGAAQKRYDLVNLHFIEPGFLVLSPGGEVVEKIDQITTLSAEWFVWQLRRALARRPDLAGDSHQVLAARRSGDTLDLAAELLAEGETGPAQTILEGSEESNPSPRSHLLRARLARLQRRPEQALRHLAALGADPRRWPAGALLEHQRLALAQGRPAAALARYEQVLEHGLEPRQEAIFLQAIALHQLHHIEKARALWKELAALGAATRWSRKAAAELQRLGPFSRAFELYQWLPADAFLEDPDGTRVPRDPEKIDWLAQRAVALLLRTQKPSGCWDDSIYDFGGTASLPNVYAAVTALAAGALLAWPRAAPQDALEGAIERATTYLLDESNIARGDRNEILWADAYRLVFFARYLQAQRPRASAVRAKSAQLVASLQAAQLADGAYRHEYPNPFATATAIQALAAIARAGVTIDGEALARAARKLATARGADGTVSSGFRRRGGARPPGAGGRMPLCELALVLAGLSDQDRLAHALEVSFEQHTHLAAVRKVDDHADRYANGGFFFWYDMLGRCDAIAKLADSGLRERLRGRMRSLVLALPEIDGGFVDSHELGRCYGTAMGLLCLARAR